MVADTSSTEDKTTVATTPVLQLDEETVLLDGEATKLLSPDLQNHPPAQSPPVPPPTSGQSVSPDQLPIGFVLNGRFILEGELGRGGMGIVYKAIDLRKQEAKDREPYVAIKVLRESFQKNPYAFISLQRETKKAQKLAHPNIATVYDFDRDGQIVYMTMEILEGESFGQMLKRISPARLPYDQVLPMIEGIGDGLSYAHKRGIVHSDFKPGNVFITKSGEFRILDFGIARAITQPDQAASDATVFDPGSLGALTPAYASCEMFNRAEPDPRDDIYAFACVCYELLAGRHPFNRVPANQAAISQAKYDPIAGLTRKQNQALEKALAFQRNERTLTIQKFMEDFRPAVSSGTRSKVLTGVAVLSLVIFLLAGAAYVLLLKQQKAQPVVYQREEPEVQKNIAIVPKPAPPSSPQNMPQEERASVPEKEVPPDPDTQAKIDRILEIADLHLMVGRYAEPDGSNALDAYLAVLDLHPTNKYALAGLSKIEPYLEQEIVTAIDKNDMKTALSLVSKGLAAWPNNTRFIELKNMIAGQ